MYTLYRAVIMISSYTFFPCFLSARYNYFEFWLIHLIACVLCDWFSFYDIQLKTALRYSSRDPSISWDDGSTLVGQDRSCGEQCLEWFNNTIPVSQPPAGIADGVGGCIDGLSLLTRESTFHQTRHFSDDRYYNYY